LRRLTIQAKASLLRQPADRVCERQLTEKLMGKVDGEGSNDSIACCTAQPDEYCD